MPVETGKKIEVIEFFSYGCPHCGELEPLLQAWLKSAGGRAVPPRSGDVPAALGEPREGLLHARSARRGASCRPTCSSRSTASNAPLWNEKTFFDWAASKGLDRKKVEDIYNSFAIDGKMNRAKQLAQTYNIQSVPTMIVDGKFATRSGEGRRARAACRAAIDALIAKARAERPKVASDQSIRSRRRSAPDGASSSPAPRPGSARRSRGTTRRRARRSACSRGARPSSRALAASSAGARSRPTRRRARRRRRSPARRAISSRASACPTSSSPTRASRAAR